jgi:peptidoglycan hydrolase-like protein with peptidoglycan-binding domain
MALQVILNANGFQVAASGAGSPGNESTYFGSLTQSALGKWQASKGVTPPAGYFGPLTRAALASSGACGAGTGTGPVTPVPGTGLSVSAGAQPQNALAPQNARVPFTKFTLTAGSNGAVTVNGVVVERAGLGTDASFAGVVLIDDSTGAQIGTQKTFNSNHQATVGETMTIPAGSSKTFTVAGIMQASNSTHAGEAPALAVVAVNTTATVSGSLPITGAYHTINATLSIGSVSTSTSSFDPGANQNKNIGDAAVRVSGIRLTANSSEDVKLHSIRWRQVGTASAADISNVMTYVDGVA